MPVALVPASAAPATAPVAAPKAAPVKTSPTTFFALLRIPGRLRLPAFFVPLFLLDADEPDFLAVALFFVLFLVAIHFVLSNVNDFRALGPSVTWNCKDYAAKLRTR